MGLLSIGESNFIYYMHTLVEKNMQMIAKVTRPNSSFNNI